MFDKELVKYLLVPLVLLLALIIWLHFCLNWDGFFLNLTAEVIGIIITVLYVDYILKRRDKFLYESVDNNINKRINDFILSCFLAIRTSLGVRGDISDDISIYAKKPKDLWVILNKAIKDTIEPNLFKSVAALNQNYWLNLNSEMENIINSTNNILNIFGQRLEPKLYSKIMELQDCATIIRLFYEFKFTSFYKFRSNVLAITSEDLTHPPKVSNYDIEYVSTEIKKMLNLIISIGCLNNS